ncbi:hypothetical protein ABIE45_006329 [Methylobacterium sp. OAE515]
MSCVKLEEIGAKQAQPLKPAYSIETRYTSRTETRDEGVIRNAKGQIAVGPCAI